MDSYTKRSISILVALILLISVFPIFAFGFGQPSGADSEDWYMTVEGVLEDDTYVLYPYEKANLVIGFSKFGELINTLENVGLEYGDRDAIAPPAGSSIPAKIPNNIRQSGWLINITYFNIPEREVRNVWACALFSDLYVTGNDWIRVDDDWLGGLAGSPEAEDVEYPYMPGYFINNPTEFGYGGRKTNGTVVTDPIEVLYDGPRRFIARCVNHVYDWVQTSMRDGYVEPLVDVVITIDFNKVNKEIIVMNDVHLVAENYVVGEIDLPIYKWIPPEGEKPGNLTTVTETIGGLIVQFSDRGRWDIGASPEFKSYVHFYTEGNEVNLSDPLCTDDLIAEGLATVYNDNYTTTDTLPSNLLSRHGPEPRRIDDVNSTFDLAQIISDDLEYVGFAAFWPSLSDWSVDAGRLNQWWKSLTINDKHSIDGNITSEPFRSPYVIGEWDFILTDTPTLYDDHVRSDTQFRGVKVCGMTDRNAKPSQIDWIWYPNNIEVGDGSDIEISSLEYLRIDREVAYQLMGVFNPWDLINAVNNNSSRWVELSEGLGDDNEIDLSTSNLIPMPYSIVENYDYVYLNMTTTLPFYSDEYNGDGIIGDDPNEIGEFFRYSAFPERVLVELDPVNKSGELTLLKRGEDYVINVTDGTVQANVYFIEDGEISNPLEIEEGALIKVLYSTRSGSYEWVNIGRDAEPIDNLSATLIKDAFDSLMGISVKYSALDMNNPDKPSLLRKFGLGDEPVDYYYYYNASLEGDLRTALKDDWNSTVPISSSNIITVGGPMANVFAEYYNEFTQVVYRQNKFDFLFSSDWGATFYGSTRGYALDTKVPGTLITDLGRAGIGTLSTYIDINGTFSLMVYGYRGKDTFWASQALFDTELPIFVDDGNGVLDWIDENDNSLMDPEDSFGDDIMLGEIYIDNNGELKWFFLPGIVALKMQNPGVTSLVMLIYYDIQHSSLTQDFPVILLVEKLGTITEKPQHPEP